VPIALQDQSFDLFPIARFSDIERNPTVVAEIRRDLIARICRQEALLLHSHPEAQRQSSTGVARHAEGLFTGEPHRVTELAAFA
jgi:hypothetical protein